MKVMQQNKSIQTPSNMTCKIGDMEEKTGHIPSIFWSVKKQNYTNCHQYNNKQPTGYIYNFQLRINRYLEETQPPNTEQEEESLVGETALYIRELVENGIIFLKPTNISTQKHLINTWRGR